MPRDRESHGAAVAAVARPAGRPGRRRRSRRRSCGLRVPADAVAAAGRTTVEQDSEKTSSRTETAAAALGRSPSTRPMMYTEATSVLYGMLPEMSTTEPNSPMQRAKRERRPVRIAGTRFGRTIRRMTVSGDAPSDAAASSMSRSSSSSTGWTDRTMNGRVTNSSAMRIDDLRIGDVDAERAARAVERQERQSGDDGRQRERQVDEAVDDAPCPGSRPAPAPRRSSVPITALMTTTMSDTENVSCRAATRLRAGDCGEEPLQALSERLARSARRSG